MQKDRWKHMSSTCHHCYVISHHVTSVRVGDKTFALSRKPNGTSKWNPYDIFCPKHEIYIDSINAKAITKCILEWIVPKKNKTESEKLHAASCEFLWKVDKIRMGFLFLQIKTTDSMKHALNLGF
jgi:hypothetical protein